MANVCLPPVVMPTTHNSQDKRDPLHHGDECTMILFRFSVLVLHDCFSGRLWGLSEALPVFPASSDYNARASSFCPQLFFCHASAAAAGGFLQPQQICVPYGTLNLAVSFVKLLWAVLCVYF